MRSEYYEKISLRILPFMLTQVVLCLGMVSPFVRDYRPIVSLLGVLVFALFIIEIRIAFDKHPVLVITDEWISLKGLRPGFAKILQLWHREQIQLDEIIDIRVGKIREAVGRFKISLPPLGEPMSSSHIRRFLWIRYRKGGRDMELYYPHTPLIKNFDHALNRLRQLKPCKLVEFGEGLIR